MKSVKILVITDSVSMPRPGIPYEETWLYHLKREFPQYDFIDRPSRGSTTRRLVTEGGRGIDLLESYRPNLVIMQMGVTECAPRFFKKPSMEYGILKRLPAHIRDRYINRVKRKRVRDPHIVDVTPEQFRAHLRDYCGRAHDISARIIILLINPPTDLFISKSPHIQKNIDLYNGIYREIARSYDNVEVIAPFEGVDINKISIDELHISPAGSNIIFRALKDHLKKNPPGPKT